ncbi:hypothetical protein Back2_12850 [Nocardioides baekrokdamisoli]|uniref:Protein kinase domain-containing protein n=1 Tax=Nocardioides baekrokdamisoli TaxID=1804624 RepID=A0A3G9J038_9ACTN|nr:serine/threonine-protein kinase [Nocardioides baekrokdamisoli]BBH16998.1 hypothetical protein Back2_12850 [Nocardioides baekrokdamisoli]
MALNGTQLVHACGAGYEADAVFCPGCWQPVAAAAIPVAAKAETVVICPHCDRETPPGERCVRCLDALVPIAEEVAEVDEWQRVNLPAPLRDRYTFLRELPSGGQADVLICSDNDDHERLVVVKIYRPGMSLEDAAIDELRAGATDRSHVVPIYDFGRTGGVAWEVQEYVAGGSLAEVFRDSAPFADLGVALRLTRQLWAAISYLHERHLIHRDLKPSNVLVRTEEPLDIALADFGLVALLEATLDVRTVVGTTTYLPPESRGNIVSKSMDWWAMGLILVEALTGRHLFAGGDGMLADAVVRNQLYEGTFAIPTTGMPRWDALLAGLLAVDYEQRWGSVEVGEWLQGRTVLPKGSGAERRGGSVPFSFGRRTYADPAALAEAMRGDSAAALRLLAGPGADGLRSWLRGTRVGDAAEDLLVNAADDPDGTLIRLQVVLDPSRPPAYRNRMLTKAGLNAVVRDAIAGDVAAGTWIRQLREQRILTAWAQVEGSISATADGRLAAAWVGIDARLSEIPREIHQAIRGQLEGHVLQALSTAAASDLLRRGRAEAQGDFVGWAARLSYAVRSADASVGDAALAYLTLPRVQTSVPSGDAPSPERVAIENVADRAAQTIERQTIRSDRHRIMVDELARFWPGWLVVVGAMAWGLHGLSGQTWINAGSWAMLIGGVSAVLIAARHLIPGRVDTMVGWAFCTAAVAGAAQSFASSLSGLPPHAPVRAWVTLAAVTILGAWLARVFNVVVSRRVRDVLVPDLIPAQWLRRPALVAAAFALLADACRRYADVAVHTHGRVGHTLSQLAAQSPGVGHAASRVAQAVHPFGFGLPVAAVSVTAALVATVFLFGSPDLARINPCLLAGVRAAVIVLGVVAAAGSATALVLVTGAGGLAVLLPLVAAAAALLVIADNASA